VFHHVLMRSHRPSPTMESFANPLCGDAAIEHQGRFRQHTAVAVHGEPDGTADVVIGRGGERQRRGAADARSEQE
jgi:hypothetical protein